MDCSMPGLPVHHQLPELTQTHVHWVSDAIQPSHLLSSPSACLHSFPASGSFQMSQFFSSGGQSIKSFSFSISPFNEYSVPISFRIDRLALLAVQGTLKSLLQHHSSKASIIQRSAFFKVQLSHPNMSRCTINVICMDGELEGWYVYINHYYWKIWWFPIFSEKEAVLQKAVL